MVWALVFSFLLPLLNQNLSASCSPPHANFPWLLSLLLLPGSLCISPVWFHQTPHHTGTSSEEKPADCIALRWSKRALRLATSGPSSLSCDCSGQRRHCGWCRTCSSPGSRDTQGKLRCLSMSSRDKTRRETRAPPIPLEHPLEGM